jgi:two-component sensor histidine kinase
MALGVAGLLLLGHAAMVSQLQASSQRMADREASLYAWALTQRLQHRQDDDFLEDVMRGSEIPLVYTSLDGTVRHWHNLVLDGDTIPDPPATLDEGRLSAIASFTDECEALGHVRPIVVGGTPIGILYHGNYGGTWRFPAFFASGAVVLVLLFLVGFGTLRIMQGTERSLLWVGLARETAHQLGTPISSLMGWAELLRLRAKGSPKPEKLLQIAEEMDKDIGRLRQVADRFSQIGSRPDLRSVDIDAIVQGTADYFRPRLPHQDRTVTLSVTLGNAPRIQANAELLGWVLENLVKNALDAMDKETGSIQLRTSVTPRGAASLEVEDNGKGLSRDDQRNVFLPGWTTKKRGWGLGLALARRIVEQYHGGRIWVRHSRPGEGTIFAIELPAMPPEPEED